MIIWIKPLKASINFFSLFALILTVTGCVSLNNIRPDAITPNFQSKLTVMTFNIRRGCGRDNWGSVNITFLKGCKKKTDAIIAAIKSADPDVVGLQEVNGGHVGTIAKALNMNYTYSSHAYSRGRWWGNVVLTKFKILEAESIAIGGYDKRNRVMVSATARVNDKPITFASIHRDHRQIDSQSIKRVLDYVNSINSPIVLIGDFNMAPRSPNYQVLVTETGIVDSAGSVPYGVMGTWDRPSSQRIDYVFVQSKYFTILDYSLVAEEHYRASDHIAYYTTIEFKQ